MRSHRFSLRCALLGSFLIDPNLHTFAVYTWTKSAHKKCELAASHFFSAWGWSQTTAATSREFIYRHCIWTSLAWPHSTTAAYTQNDWQSGKWRTSSGLHINELLCTRTNSRPLSTARRNRRHLLAKINQQLCVVLAVAQLSIFVGVGGKFAAFPINHWAATTIRKAQCLCVHLIMPSVDIWADFN